MKQPTTCSQHNCDDKAVVRYTWPGKDEAGACAEHALKLQGVSRAMGLHLQLILIPLEES